MSNMSYCRFQNTAGDLADCLNYVNVKVDSREEDEARKRLVKLCRQVVEQFDDEPNEERQEECEA